MSADLITITRKQYEADIREAKAEAWDECESASYEIRLNPKANAWEPVKDNPYRTQS